MSYLIPDSSPRRRDCEAQSAKKKLSRKLHQTVSTVYFILGILRPTSGDMVHIQTFETPREPRIVRRNDTVHDATTKRYIYMLIPVKTMLNIHKQINGKKCPDIFYLVNNQVTNPSKSKHYNGFSHPEEGSYTRNVFFLKKKLTHIFHGISPHQTSQHCLL